VPFINAPFYADDTNLFIKGNNVKIMEDKLNQELIDISLWLKVNKLTLNIDKTHYMLFHSKKKVNENLYIKIDNKLIDRVAHTKFLGVFIDDKLNWKQHINYISGKVSRCIGMLIKSRKLLNKDSLLTLYFSFVYPLLIYCNHVWGSTYATTLYRLDILQKKIIRIIAGTKPRSSSEPLFTELEVLEV
jgi:hypothetical protein